MTTWTHPALDTFRVTKLTDNDGAAHLWRYELGGWVFTRVVYEPGEWTKNHTYLGEDHEYTYWK